MRVSVVNFCSTALDMLEFSTDQAVALAGGGDFDYLGVTWNPSPEVDDWLKAQPGIRRAHYETDPNLAYVPNLRKMMSFGFDEGYRFNDYVAIINTDMAFSSDWLLNLARQATEDVIPNSVHVTPIDGPATVKEDCGVPTLATFQQAKWEHIVRRLQQRARAHARAHDGNVVMTPEDLGGDWRTCATMPYVLHKKWWERYGPWEPNLGNQREAPDRRFFGRCHAGGAKFILCLDSICYHHEAVERRSARRPIGVENMEAGL